MDGILVGLAVFLLLNMAAGAVAGVRARSAIDVLPVAMLFGTTGTGLLVLLAAALELPALRDIALVVVLVAVVPVAAFVRARGRDPDRR